MIISRFIYLLKKKLQFIFLNFVCKNNLIYNIYIKTILIAYKKNANNYENNLLFFPYKITINNFNYNKIIIFGLNLNDNIPLWNYDYLYNYKFDNSIFYKSILIPKGKGDIKVPWEISRLQYLIFWGLLFKISNNEEYRKLFLRNINYWLNENKIFKGVNWACTMDVAIRAINMILSYELFEKHSKLKSFPLKQFIKILFLHTYFVRTNLEKSFKVQGNHYLSDISGLIILSLYLKDQYRTNRWFLFALKQILKEIDLQIYNDGTNFEASTCYHRLALELFFYPLFFIFKNYEKSNINIKNKSNIQYYYKEKIFKLFNAILFLLKPNGEMPQIGDNDSGQFIKLYPRKVLDMRYLLLLGAVFYENPEWKIKEFFKSEDDISELLILYGDEGKSKWDSLQSHSINYINSHAFRDSGWYVMRKNTNYCIVSCGPNGQNDFGGHAHNDKLSFELFLNGADIIIDPGTYVYTPEPDLRNLFRSTRYHNTVMIDNEEQNRFVDGELFLLRNDAKAKCINWITNNDKDEFVGEHYGYTRMQDPVIHRRKFIFEKNLGKLVIIDSFTGKKEHLFEWNFILHPDVSEKIKITSEKIEVVKEQCYYSPEYGVKKDTKKLVFRLYKKPPFNLTITIDSSLIFSVNEL